MPFDQLVEQVMDGTIEDAKTVATVLKDQGAAGPVRGEEKEGFLWERPS